MTIHMKQQTHTQKKPHHQEIVVVSYICGGCSTIQGEQKQIDFKLFISDPIIGSEFKCTYVVQSIIKS